VTAVGVVGIGRMGGSMARALAAAGFEVICWNRTGAVAEEVAAELGGRAVRRPADVAAAADVCISMLADGDAVERVYRGPDGLLAGARPGNVLVDSSTVPPSTLRRLEGEARRAGAGILDAPVSGSVALAESGGLTIMVGGDVADLEAARPVLEALAKTVFHMGPLGSGAAMKLAVNAVIFGLNQALAEGLVLAEAAGIDRAHAYDVLAASAVGAPYVGYKRASFLDPDATPVAFALELAAKDLRLIEQLADETGVPVPQARTNLGVIAEASDGGNGGRDFSAVAEYLRGSGASSVQRRSR
jgi:3-hydroxyisobutyrate dehydrogenase-like beta-hydroxyacid dehydrogenase